MVRGDSCILLRPQKLVCTWSALQLPRGARLWCCLSTARKGIRSVLLFSIFFALKKVQKVKKDKSSPLPLAFQLVILLVVGTSDKGIDVADVGIGTALSSLPGVEHWTFTERERRGIHLLIDYFMLHVWFLCFATGFFMCCLWSWSCCSGSTLRPKK